MSKNRKFRNIYYMLCYCVNELAYFENSNIDYESITSTNDLLAKLLIESFKNINNHGLLKGYSNKEIVTSKPRGSIDLYKSVYTGNKASGKMVCNIKQLDTNILINKIIKACFKILLNNNETSDDKISEDLLYTMRAYLNQLSGIDDITINKNILNRKFNVPDWYKPAITVCKIIINDYIYKDVEGNHSALQLNNEKRLCYIFEKFLLNFINKNYGQYKVSKIALRFSNNTSDSGYVIPDIVIIDEVNYKIAILDAKYYNEYKFSNANASELCQNCMAIKTKDNFGNKYSVSGLNVYATDRSSGVNMESIRPLDWCNVTYGDYLFALDCDIEQLKEQIRALIECCFNLNKYSK